MERCFKSLSLSQRISLKKNSGKIFDKLYTMSILEETEYGREWE